MKRKIIQIADTTQAITIPREFSLFNKLKKGELLDVDIINNSLVIRNTKNIDTQVELDLTDLNLDLIWRHLVTAYRKGTSSIIVKYSNNKDLELIQRFSKDLIGMVIIKHDNNTLIIKDLFEKNDIDIKDTIIRIFSLLIEGSEETLEALKNNKSISDDINLRDYNINKFTNLCLRILNKYGYYDYEKILSYYKIISILEEVGDEYRRIANVNLRINDKISKEIIDYFDELNLLLKNYFEIFSKYDKAKLIKFYENADNLLSKLKKSYSKRKGNEIHILSCLDTILHLIKSLIEENFILSL